MNKMDVSRQTFGEDNSCAGVSMYLSFESNNTSMSSAAYKTVDAMGDLSAMQQDAVIDDVSMDSCQNSTLEADVSHLKTVRKAEQPQPLGTASPLRAFPKNILKEYKALSSTPTKEQLMRSVEVVRGSEMERRCMDMGLAFLGMQAEEEEKNINTFFLEENKENAHPESEGSTLSSSVEISGTSVIEKKAQSNIREDDLLNVEKAMQTMHSLHETNKDDAQSEISTVSSSSSCVEVITSVIEVNTMTDIKQAVNAFETINDYRCNELEKTEHIQSISKISSVTATTSSCTQETTALKEAVELENTMQKDGIRADTLINLSKPTVLYSMAEEPTDELDEHEMLDAVTIPKVEIKQVPTASSSGIQKPKTGIYQSKLTRKSVCEPDLKNNRPSRMLCNNRKRISLAANAPPQPLDAKDFTNIPKLLDKMLKISNTGDDKANVAVKPLTASTAANEVRKSTKIATKNTSRTSLLPEKRPYNFSQRMSIVVKTTLNSPARKIARNSLLPNGQVSKMSTRRSVMPPAGASAVASTSKITTTQRRSVMPSVSTATQRRSMLPTSAAAASSTRFRSAAQTIQKRPSFLPTSNSKSAALQTVGEQSENKGGEPACKSKLLPSSSTFSCNICARQFRIKSLLDAHKRSHEMDDAPDAGATKITTVTATTSKKSASESTQCKYCDKKFAIVRALHIHLLQNCVKIPPGDKKKLQFTEMQHVEKAALPAVFAGSAANSANNTKLSAKSHSSLSSVAMSSTESLLENKVEMLTHELTAAVNAAHTHMAPPLAHGKLKKQSAHAGIYRTPSKSVPCHLCKQTFKNILDYTTHSMAMHSTHAEASPTFDDNTMETAK